MCFACARGTLDTNRRYIHADSRQFRRFSCAIITGLSYLALTMINAMTGNSAEPISTRRSKTYRKYCDTRSICISCIYAQTSGNKNADAAVKMRRSQIRK